MKNFKQFLSISIFSILASQASANVTAITVPDPAILSLLGIGLLGLGLARRKIKHTDSSK